MATPNPQITTRDLFCIERPSEPCAVAIFGASGDLAHRKLLPALFNLYSKGLTGERFSIIGAGRTEMSDEAFRDDVNEVLLEEYGYGAAELPEFIRRCFYQTGDYGDPAFYTALGQRLEQLAGQFHTDGNVLFYLSVPPKIYPAVVERLAQASLVQDRGQDGPWRRVVIEKPFGYDLQTARDLNGRLHQHLNERQTYRIDHYLGKDTVQNIFILRFANAIFEPVWNSRYIDHVQITVAETVGVEHRAGYFDQAGLLRDMFQNHMLQMLTMVAMEPPASFDANRILDEKVKLLRSIRPVALGPSDASVLRGQYGPGELAGRPFNAYRNEPGVPAASNTETYAAMRIMIDNWRWQGVPFYLRAGKRLPKKVSEIAIYFQHVPHSVFQPIGESDLASNVLVLNVQPDEGVALAILAKHPGPKLCMSELTMAFKYRDAFGGSPPDAYERLLHDAMLGDQTLYIRYDCLEASWMLIDPILTYWQQQNEKTNAADLAPYPAGSWGPPEADQLLARDGRAWRTL